MMPLTLLIAFLAVPILLLVLLRVNAAFVFLALCLGDVLVQFAGNDAVSIVSGASLQAHTTASTIQLLLLLLPAALTVLFMMNTVRSKQQVFNILPAAGVGLLTVLLAVPLLAPGLRATLTSSSLWGQIQTFQAGLVAVSTLVCLLFLWLLRPKHIAKAGKHHKD